MLNKLFKALVEQPYRYLTVDGAVHDRPFWDRFHHRAEFKSVAALAVTTAVLRAAFNETATVADCVAPVALALAGYTFARSSKYINQDARYDAVFKRGTIVDTQPQKGQVTSPSDLAKVIQVKDTYRNPINMAANFLLCSGIFFNMRDVIRGGFESPSMAMNYSLSGFFLGLGAGVFCSIASGAVRANRIIDGDYVILPEAPKSQEKKEYETFSLPQAAAPVPIPIRP